MDRVIVFSEHLCHRPATTFQHKSISFISSLQYMPAWFRQTRILNSTKCLFYCEPIGLRCLRSLVSFTAGPESGGPISLRLATS